MLPSHGRGHEFESRRVHSQDPIYERGEDRPVRPPARHVYPQGEEMFNETLLREGYAQVATFPPNTRYEDRFRAAQEEARSARRGLWGLFD